MDEKPSSYPADVPGPANSAGAPPSYGEGDPAATRVVYVQALPKPDSGPPAKDYFGLSLFTLLCCFWPLGLVALIKSVEVRRHNSDGMFNDARKASKDAHLFNKLGIIIGSIATALSLVIFVMVFAVSLGVNLAFIPRRP